MKCFAGHLKNSDELLSVASGGMATALARQIIGKRGVVYGVVFAPDFRSVLYERADTFDSLKRFKGSKYLKPDIRPILASLIGDLEKGKNVLFFGLPCNTFAVQAKTLQLDSRLREKLFLVDLICNGVTDDSVLSEFVSWLEQKYREPIVSLRMRAKCPAWSPPYFVAEFASGKTYREQLYRTDFGMALSRMLQPRCYACKLRGNNRCSDLTLGDCWGLPETHGGRHASGTSLAVCHTDKGMEMLMSLDSFVLVPVDTDTALASNPRFFSPAPHHPTSQVFLTTYKTSGLHTACLKVLPVKSKMTSLLRNMKSMGWRYLFH